MGTPWTCAGAHGVAVTASQSTEVDAATVVAAVAIAIIMLSLSLSLSSPCASGAPTTVYEPASSSARSGDGPSFMGGGGPVGGQCVYGGLD